MELKPTAILRLGTHGPPRPAQTIVEFALVSFVLFALIFGIVEFGRAITTRVMLTNAVREATRAGVITPTNTTAMINAAAARSPMLGLASTNLTPSPVCTTWTNTATSSSALCVPPNRLQVCISYNFTFIVARMMGISGTISMSECGIGLIQ